ncbi:TetR/AcrR family transcriptional regulator [Cohnella massiliensis]|uniref:TetR/AcrR family transcriptional regulator n=1 Tax=Cohnella massiliensis TaxID=1816691 RepID=UPI0009BC25C7|nr:TetR/AcrR family transcriptional regulator [Cohnella massiliensis]
MFVGISARQTQASESAIKQKRRTKIKQVAERLFIRQGIHETSMQQIADELGMGRRTIYHYYNTKEEIAIDIQQDFLGRLQAVDGLDDVLQTPKAGFGKTEAMLELVLDHYLRHISEIEYLNEFDRVFKNAESYEFTTPELEQYGVYRLLHAALNAGIADGSIRPMTEREVSGAILTINHALFALITRIVGRREIFKQTYDYDLKDIRMLVNLIAYGLKNG